MKLSWIVILIVSGSLVLASCGNDNDEIEEPEAEDQTIAEEAEPEEEAAEDEPLQREEREEDPFEREPDEPARAPETEQREIAGPVDIIHQEDGRYTIQLFSWENPEFAELRLEEWKKKGYEEAYLTETVQNGTTMYRLRLGRFPSLSVAQQTMENLKDSYDVDPWVDNYEREE